MINDGAQADADNFNTAFVSRTSAQSINGGKQFQKYIATNKLDVATTATIAALSSTTSFVKMTGSTTTTIQGVTAGVDGQEIVIYNGSSATVTIAHQNGSATAANRVVFAGATDLALIADQTAVLKYDTTQARWIATAIPVTSTTPATTIRDYVHVYGANSSASTGMGSTNTWVRRFINLGDNAGTAITYADSATLGATFTINSNGLYSISYWDQAITSTAQPIITKNSANLTSAALGDSIGTISDTPAGAIGQSNATLFLTAGDIIRAQDAVSRLRGGINSKFIGFSICKVGN